MSSKKSTTVKSHKGSIRNGVTRKSASSKNFHVLPRDERWAVVREGNLKPTSVYDTQGEAIEAARKIAKVGAGQLVIHGRNGRIRERDHYGHDPSPPRKARKVLHPSEPPRTTKRDAISKAVTDAVREAGSSF